MARAPQLMLEGKSFGMLTVLHRAGRDKSGKLYWCCQCSCGATLAVRDCRLRARGSQRDREHPQVSCGCLRADSKVRAAARQQLDPARRRQISMDAARAVSKRSKPYAMSGDRAAELLGVSQTRLGIMVSRGELKGVMRDGNLWVAKGEVGRLVKEKKRSARQCHHR